MAIKNTLLGGTDNANGEVIDADDVNDTNNAIIEDNAPLGEVRMFALSMTGAVTKANLQTRGWAICDGTTPATQGISSPTIATTPDLQDKFISMSNDESSGSTGGSATMAHTHTHDHQVDTSTPTNPNGGTTRNISTDTDSTPASNTENRPPFYELVFFMKVKI